MEDQRNNNPTEDEIEIETTNDGEGFDVITLESEDGPADYLFLDLVTMDDVDYAVLLPLEGEDAEEEGVLIVRCVSDPEDEDYDLYEDLEDDALEEKVYQLFKERNQGVFDLAD